MTPEKKDWHRLSADEALDRLDSTAHGIGKGEAHRRLAEHGPNVLTRQEGPSKLQVFFRQFTDLLVLIMLGAAAITLLIGHLIDAGVIVLLVVLNAIVGYVQEVKAGEALAALQRMTAPKARVRRDGGEPMVPARDLVPGDVVVLEAGDRVPADLRIFDSHELSVNESALTGESLPVVKQTGALEAPDLIPAERTNMAFMGTVVTSGDGMGVVVGTGDGTEFGAIAAEVGGQDALETPLKKRMARFSRIISLVVLPVAAALFMINYWQTGSWFDAFLTAVATAVAIIPEALPIVVTIALAIGLRRMARRNAIIRHLPAVETLGSCTFICSDKTGTLTQNRMAVTRLYLPGETLAVTGPGDAPEGEIESASDADRLAMLLRIGLLANEAEVAQAEGAWQVSGDPTEGALVMLAMKGGLDREEEAAARPRRDEVPFTSERQYMATLHEGDGDRAIFLKGAPEVVLDLCDDVSEADRRAVRDLADDGLRVLAFAWRPASSLSEAAVAEGGFRFAGLTGMIDPPRPEAVPAVDAVQSQGITVVMITGDHQDTAIAIARHLDIVREGEDVEVLTGKQLAAMDDETLARHVQRVRVYARVQPADKSRIVRALKAAGEIVAVTGDGVNDAPALKAADIGVAMGRSGTDVAKEAADIVLADDNFATLRAAVEEGRVAFANIRKTVLFLLTTAVGFTATMATPVVLGMPVPLLPLQVLYVNLFGNGMADVALALEARDPSEIAGKPRPTTEGVLTPLVVWRLLLGGLLLAAAVIPLFMWTLRDTGDAALARSVALATVITWHQFYVFGCRSLHRPAWATGIRENPWLVGSVALNLVGAVLVLYWGPFQAIFHTVAVPLAHWGPIVAVSTIGLVGIELEKAIRRRAAA